MIRTYKYTIKGRASGGQQWQTEGEIADAGNDLVIVFNRAMESSFHQLTNGQAVFGKPGVGCKGPYSIQSALIEKLPWSFEE